MTQKLFMSSSSCKMIFKMLLIFNVSQMSLDRTNALSIATERIISLNSPYFRANVQYLKKISQSLILSHMTTVSANQNTRHFQIL